MAPSLYRCQQRPNQFPLSAQRLMSEQQVNQRTYAARQEDEGQDSPEV